MRYWSRGMTNTVCPYYQRESQYTISCEGLVEGADAVQRFTKEEDKEKYQQKECYRYPNDCPIARLLDRRYRD